MKSNISLYVHIPFCIKKCSYCDFVSFANSKALVNDYLISLEKEVSLYKDKIKNYNIETIFIGGGTPTSLDKIEFKRLLDIIDAGFSLLKNKNYIEYTVEANPKTITPDIGKLLHEYGVNRVSLGLQSSNENELKILGRAHTFNDIKESISILRKNKINNINVDLIYGVPTQTLSTFKKSLEDVISLSIEHISCYSLILEEGTKLYEKEKSGEIILPSEDEDLSMYEMAIEILKKNGYNQYEISNFAKKNMECRHNIVYWKNKEYLGLGASAHGFIDKERYSNANNLEEYSYFIGENKHPITHKEKITKEMLFEEWVFLRLRMKDGILYKDINSEFGIDFKEKYFNILKKLESEQLINFDNERLNLTTKGFELSNYVFLEILSL